MKTEDCYLVIYKACEGRSIFNIDRDYRFYCYLLKKNKADWGIKIFGYCLIEKTIYLIMQGRHSGGILGFMNAVCQDYARYFFTHYCYQNNFEKGKFTVILLDGIPALCTAIKHVEFIPVNKLSLLTPLIYPWSSCRYRILCKRRGILDALILKRNTLQDLGDHISPQAQEYFPGS
jgi:putative transposase